MATFKTYILEPISSIEKAAELLGQMLPEDNSTWLLLSPNGEPVGCFNIEAGIDHDYGPGVWADQIGQHDGVDEQLLDVLRRLQTQLGGEIGWETFRDS